MCVYDLKRADETRLTARAGSDNGFGHMMFFLLEIKKMAQKSFGQICVFFLNVFLSHSAPIYFTTVFFPHKIINLLAHPHPHQTHHHHHHCHQHHHFRHMHPSLLLYYLPASLPSFFLLPLPRPPPAPPSTLAFLLSLFSFSLVTS